MDASLESHDDSARLHMLGKKPVLKRTFGIWTLLGFSCTILVTWEGILLTFGTAYSQVGPAGSIYAFIVVWIGMCILYACLCELVSIAPLASGQYHWVHMLASKRTRALLSYVTGWWTLTGWQASAASGAFNSAVLIQGLIGLCNEDYVAQGWHATLISWATLLFAAVVNIAASRSLAFFEGSVLIIHIAGFFAILIPLVHFAPTLSTSDVFLVWQESLWSSRTLSFFVALVGPVYTFVGSDSAFHIAEEVAHAATVVPKAVLISVLLNGGFGFGMLIGLLYSIPLLNDTISSVLMSPLGFPFVQVFLNATGCIPGAVVMTSLILVLGISSTVGLVASSSRLYWAFSRDQALPFSKQLTRVNSRTSLPVNAIVLTITIAGILTIVGIGSSFAFNILISVTVTGLFASYWLPVALLLWRRTQMLLHGSTSLDTDSKISWGPFHLPTYMGLVNNACALVFTTVIFIFAFFPASPSVNAMDMNYAILVFGAVSLLAAVWYFIGARKAYHGPVRDDDMLSQDDQTLEEAK